MFQKFACITPMKSKLSVSLVYLVIFDKINYFEEFPKKNLTVILFCKSVVSFYLRVFVIWNRTPGLTLRVGSLMLKRKYTIVNFFTYF